MSALRPRKSACNGQSLDRRQPRDSKEIGHNVEDERAMKESVANVTLLSTTGPPRARAAAEGVEQERRHLAPANNGDGVGRHVELRRSCAEHVNGTTRTPSIDETCESTCGRVDLRFSISRL